MQREEEYLQKMGKSVSDFSSDTEKLVYLADHLEQIDTAHSLASTLSRIKSKPGVVTGAIRRKIIQCFIHYKLYGQSRFREILNGLFENSPNAELEYRDFLERMVEADSPLRKEAYLESISLFKEERSSLLFSIPDKVKILAYKYLLKIDPQHQDAIAFFQRFDDERLVSPYHHYFLVEENDWSGQGIVNEHGEWVLLPFFDLPLGLTLFNEGIASLSLIGGIIKNAKSEDVVKRYEQYGNWIKSNGDFLLAYVVPNPGTFNGGIARWFDFKNPRYINANGDFLPDLEGTNTRYLKNGYSVLATEFGVYIRGNENELLAVLDKEYADVRYFPADQLLSYGTTGRECKYGFMDLTGAKVTDAIFYTSWDLTFHQPSFKGKNLMVIHGHGGYGMVNRRFDILIPFEYEKLVIINSLYVVGTKNQMWILFTSDGQISTKPVPETFKSNINKFAGDIGLIDLHGKKYMVDLEGMPVPRFDGYEIVDFQQGYIILKKTGLSMGMCTVEGELVLPFEYDEILVLSKDIVLGKVREHYVTINLASKTTHQFPDDYKLRKYDADHTEQFIRFEKDGKKGIVNAVGEVVIPFRYTRVSYWGQLEDKE